MKNRSAYFSLIAFLLFTLCSLEAQTVNTGELAIMQGTQVSTHFDLVNEASADFINDGELYVYKNFHNEGLFTFTPGENGRVSFEGTATQQLSGAMPSEFFNVSFNNTSAQPAFDLTGDVRVFGNADFLSGIIKNTASGGQLTFKPQSTHTNVDNNSHVQGPVLKEGDEAFTYPVGDGGYYRQAEISAPAELADAFTGQYFLENSDLLYPHNNVSQNIAFIDNTEYWVVERTSGKSDVILTLFWNASTTPAAITNEPASLHIVRWDATAKMWVDEGGIADTANSSVSLPIELSGYGVFTLAVVKDSVLPQDIVIYNGVSPNGDDQNDYFYIENIQLYPKNRVEIYNRWGVKLFDTRNYDSAGNVFNGYSDGRATVSREGKLPTGTYFYTIEYEYTGEGSPRTVKKAGYLYLDND